MRAATLALVAACLCASDALAQPGTTFVEARLTPSTALAGSAYGFAVAVSGDVAVVGAPREGVSGSVHVFTRSSGVWSETAILAPAAPTIDEGFGHSLALLGDTLLVGAPFDDVSAGSEPGSVFVFVRAGSGFEERARLEPPPGSSYLRFGFSIALDSEQRALVGAPHWGGFAGSVYTYTRSSDAWTPGEVLEPAGMPPGAEMGWSLAVESDTLLVGAPSYDDPGVMRVGRGGVYVFQRAVTRWIPTGLLRPSDPADRDRFGHAVALRGSAGIVGAPGDDGPSPGDDDAGAVYVFESVGGAFVETEKLVAPARTRYAAFGWSVALNGDTAFAGAPGDFDELGEPAYVYPFARTAGGWAPIARFAAESTPQHDGYAQALAVDGTTLVVGEPFADAAFVYEITRTCAVDSDCVDGESCTTDACTAARCSYAPILGCGARPDGGATDAGASDGGGHDAGINSDGAMGVDAGTDAGTTRETGGCACRVTGESRSDTGALVVLLAVSAALLRRRARSVFGEPR